MSLAIIIDSERCSRCGVCIDACPIPCFRQYGKEVNVFNEDLCIVCRNCEESCPRACISVKIEEDRTLSPP